MSDRVRRTTYATRDVDEGVAVVREAYTGSEWRAPKDRPFYSAMTFIGDDRLTLFRMQHGARLRHHRRTFVGV